MTFGQSTAPLPRYPQHGGIGGGGWGQKRAINLVQKKLAASTPPDRSLHTTWKFQVEIQRLLLVLLVVLVVFVVFVVLVVLVVLLVLVVLVVLVVQVVLVVPLWYCWYY